MRLTATATEATSFPTRTDRFGVLQVPAIVVNGRLAWAGGLGEGPFVERLLDAARSRDRP